MAPTTTAAAAAAAAAAGTGCLPTLPSSEAPPEVVGSGRRRLSLDSWVCLPLLRPVRTTTTTTSTSTASVSSSGSSCTTQQKDCSSSSKELLLLQQQQGKTLPSLPSLDVGVVGMDELEAAGVKCETPKSKEHRIPDVDVAFCPPAPRKPRAMARRRRVQPTSFFNTPDFENFLSQHKVQVSS